MSTVQRVHLSEALYEALAQARDAGEAFAILNLAADDQFTNETTAAEALQLVRGEGLCLVDSKILTIAPIAPRPRP